MSHMYYRLLWAKAIRTADKYRYFNSGGIKRLKNNIRAKLWCAYNTIRVQNNFCENYTVNFRINEVSQFVASLSRGNFRKSIYYSRQLFNHKLTRFSVNIYLEKKKTHLYCFLINLPECGIRSGWIRLPGRSDRTL